MANRQRSNSTTLRCGVDHEKIIATGCWLTREDVMALLRRDTKYHTYSDYLIWSRTSGDELINGAAFVKEPPAPSLSHQVIVMELGRQLQNALEGTSWQVFIAP